MLRDLPGAGSQDGTRDQQQQARWISLFQSLGANPAVKTARLYYSEHSGESCGPLFRLFFQSLAQITCVEIILLNGSGFEYLDCLQGHSSIETVNFLIPVERYASFLPVLQTIPALKEIGIKSTWNEDIFLDIDVSVEAAQAISKLLCADTFISEVNMNNLTFEHASLVVLCDGLVHSKIKVLDTFCCCFCDVFGFVCAIASPHLQKLHLHHILHCQPETLPNTNVTDLATMLQLKNFYSSLCDYDDEDDAAEQAAMERVVVCLVQNLADCPLLETLEVDVCTLPVVNLDDGLAECTNRCPSLQVIKLWCSNSTPAVHEFPQLFEAIKTNYRLTEVVFGGLEPDMRANIDTLLQLNKAGRGYMSVNADDRIKAVQVLEQVNPSKDCLYTHLRENPMICTDAVGSSNLAEASGRKRKSSEQEQPSPRRPRIE